MGKHKKRQRKPRRLLPDETFSRGALQLARYGRHVVMQSNWTDKGHAEFMAKAAARYVSVTQEIDDLVNRIVAAVSVLPPDALMLRAWQEQVLSSRHVKVEADVTFEDSTALRMVDYVQSIIAATSRGEPSKKELSTDDWNDLKKNVALLFTKLNLEYPVCVTAYRKAEGTVYEEAMEEFLFRARMHWCNVRGDYYQAHQIEVLADLLTNQSNLIEAAYQITAGTLVGEIEKIWKSLIFGLQDAVTSMREIHKEVMDEFERTIEQKADELASKSPGQLLIEIARQLGHGEALENSAEVIGGFGLFDLRKITDLPSALLDDFSWAPGQETDFLADGEFKGWPLRIQPIFRRPFLKLNDTYYCFELHALFDNFFRQLEKRIFLRSEGEKQEWIKNRKEISENLPVEYFSRLLPGATVHREVYYPTQVGADRRWTEADCIIAYDDHLFIIEVKAGAFTYTSPANDLPAYVKSLEALVEAPSKQGQRFLRYLDSADSVEIFDARHRPLGNLRKDEYRCKTICAITLDPFTEIAAQAQHLYKIGIDVGDTPVWPLSLGDLRVYRDIFVGPLDFLHFVEQRMSAAVSQKLALNDELDHLGLYLEHNNYAMHADEISINGGSLQFNGYRSRIDEFFSAKLSGSVTPIIPTQEMPPRLRELIDFLARQPQIHRSQIASYLLDLAGDWRSDISKWIDSELTAIPQRGRCLPMSTIGDVRLTIFVHVERIAELSHQQSTEHVQAAMIIGKELDRNLLELTYRDNELVRAEMSVVTLQGLSEEQLERFKKQAEKLKERRLVRSVEDFGKIGRNDPCPCGSGKKYKRCCMPDA